MSSLSHAEMAKILGSTEETVKLAHEIIMAHLKVDKDVETALGETIPAQDKSGEMIGLAHIVEDEEPVVYYAVPGGWSEDPPTVPADAMARIKAKLASQNLPTREKVRTRIEGLAKSLGDSGIAQATLGVGDAVKDGVKKVLPKREPKPETENTDLERPGILRRFARWTIGSGLDAIGKTTSAVGKEVKRPIVVVKK